MKIIQLIITLILLLATTIVKGQKNELDSLKFEKTKIDKSIQMLNDSLVELNFQSTLIRNKIDLLISNQIEPSNDWGMTAILTNNDSFREEPSNFSAILGKLEPGTIVSVLDYDYSYFKVLFNSKIGYIDASKEVGNKEFDKLIDLKKNKTLSKLESLENSNDHEEIIASHNAIKDNGQHISIEGIRVKRANSAGGIGIIIQWRYNNHLKELKYITFRLTPYNSVGDIQKGSVQRESTASLQVTGPLKAEDWTNENYWDSVWYNGSITCVKVSMVNVEFMDGTSYTYINELPKIFGSDFNNKCKYVD